MMDGTDNAHVIYDIIIRGILKLTAHLTVERFLDKPRYRLGEENILSVLQQGRHSK